MSVAPHIRFEYGEDIERMLHGSESKLQLARTVTSAPHIVAQAERIFNHKTMGLTWGSKLKEKCTIAERNAFSCGVKALTKERQEFEKQLTKRTWRAGVRSVRIRIGNDSSDMLANGTLARLNPTFRFFCTAHLLCLQRAERRCFQHALPQQFVGRSYLSASPRAPRLFVLSRRGPA